MILISSTSERVHANTPAMVDDHIRRAGEISVHYYKDHPHEIVSRLWELDHEWDVERAMQAWTAGLALLLIFLGWWSGWFIFFLFLAQCFALVHALHGWSPSLILLRLLGFRTAVEIEAECAALKPMQPATVKADESKTGMDEHEEHPWTLKGLGDRGDSGVSGGFGTPGGYGAAGSSGSSVENNPPVAAVSSPSPSPAAPTAPETSGVAVGSVVNAAAPPAVPSAPGASGGTGGDAASSPAAPATQPTPDAGPAGI